MSSLGVLRERELQSSLETCRDWHGPPPSCSPQPAAPASAHAGSACPHCAFCSTPWLIHPPSPWTGHTSTDIWGGGIYVNLYCLNQPQDFFIPE